MIGRIFSNWESEIVLEEGELEKITRGEILEGDFVDYDQIAKVYLSINKNEIETALYLDWNKKEASKYHFKITPLGFKRFKEKGHIKGRYENGLNGSKLDIYGHEKNNLIKKDIEFEIQMIKSQKENN